MKKNNLLTIYLCAAMLGLGISTHAEETTLEKIETGSNKAADSAKKTYRKAKDKVCEMVNGKMKCVEKKIKGKVENLKDKVETESKEIKNKID